MITVVIVDDDKEILALLEQILGDEADLLHVGSATSGEAGLKLVQKLQPDVVLMDIKLGDISGIECVRRLKPLCKKTEFVMCSIFDEDELVYGAICAGASSYLMKNNSPQFITLTIREVHEGKSPMNSDIARKIVTRMQQPQSNAKSLGITTRESQILDQLASGKNYQQISDHLNISIKTMKAHIYRIYQKLEVSNRVEAVNKYYNVNRLYNR